MRTNFLLVSLVAIAAACSDQQPTSPADGGARAARSPSASPSVNPSVDAAPVPQAKPVDQVGFTKAEVITSYFTVAAGWSDAGSVTCPDGSFAIGGGYQFYGASTTTAYSNRPTTLPNPRGWTVAIDNSKSATSAGLKVYAVCVS